MDGPSATIICPGRVVQTGRSLRRERASQPTAHPIAYMRYRFMGGDRHRRRHCLCNRVWLGGVGAA